MASYTSVQNGVWNDPATWGGSGYPSAAGDTATINHLVTYGLSSTVELGTITITNGGVLSFDTDKDTKLTLGNASIVVDNGGVFRIGTEESPLPATYTAEVVWNSTSDNSVGVTVNDGAYIELYGDSDVYGSEWNALLASDWTSGKTFTIVGDYTSKWKAGQEIIVNRYLNPGSSSYSSESYQFTISSVALNGSNTDITIVETAPGVTFYARGRVVNTTRNIHFYKYGYSLGQATYNSNRPRWYAPNETGSYILQRRFVKDVMFTAFYYVGVGSSTFTNVVCRNGYNGLGQTSGSFGSGNSSCILDGCIVYAQAGGAVYDLYPSLAASDFHRITNCHLVGCYNGIRNVYSAVIENCELYGVSIPFTGSAGCEVRNCKVFSFRGAGIHSTSASVFRNCYFFRYTFLMRGAVNNLFENCKFGYDETDTPSYYASRDADIYFSSNEMACVMQNCTPPPDGWKKTNSLNTGYVVCEDEAGNFGSVKVLLKQGRYEKVTDVVREGGGSSSIKVTVYSATSKSCPLIISPSENVRNLFSVWCQSGVEKTINVWVKAYGGWTNLPTAEELYIAVSYYSSATTCQKTTVVSTDTVSDESNWYPLSVTVTPQRTGWVYVNLYLKKYESESKGIYIDTKAEIE